MADSVIFGYLFIFLLIKPNYASLPNLDALVQDGQGRVLQQLEDPITLEKMMVHPPKYKCHLCEPPDCESGVQNICVDALYCFKSSVRESNGELQHSRGCSDKNDHYQFICRSSTRQGVHKRHAGQLNVTCCTGDMCNSGEFPAPPYHHRAPPDPSYEDMRKIVCVDRDRPEPLDYHDHPTMVSMWKLIQECWHHNPSARLSALRVRKTLLKIAAADESIHLNEDNEVSL